MQNIKALVAVASVSVFLCAVPGVASASPIDNPCPTSGSPCDFEFNVNGSQPFFEFETGETITNLPVLNSFTAHVTSAGNMTFANSNMLALDTSLSSGGVPVQMKLVFTGMTSSTTDLSGTNPYVDWTLTAVAQFIHAGLGATAVNCQTGSFNIDITGDWGDVDSATFTIPAMAPGTCGGGISPFLLNLALGLGNDGAILTLYKFGGYNGVNPLTGS